MGGPSLTHSNNRQYFLSVCVVCDILDLEKEVGLCLEANVGYRLLSCLDVNFHPKIVNLFNERCRGGKESHLYNRPLHADSDQSLGSHFALTSFYGLSCLGFSVVSEKERQDGVGLTNPAQRH